MLRRGGFSWGSGMVVTKNQPGLGPSVNWLLVFIFPVLAQKSEEAHWLMWLWLRVISDPMACGQRKPVWSGQLSDYCAPSPEAPGLVGGAIQGLHVHPGGGTQEGEMLGGPYYDFVCLFVSHCLPMTFCYLFHFSGFLFSHILPVYSSLCHFLYKRKDLGCSGSCYSAGGQWTSSITWQILIECGLSAPTQMHWIEPAF